MAGLQPTSDGSTLVWPSTYNVSAFLDELLWDGPRAATREPKRAGAAFFFRGIGVVEDQSAELLRDPQETSLYPPDCIQMFNLVLNPNNLDLASFLTPDTPTCAFSLYSVGHPRVRQAKRCTIKRTFKSIFSISILSPAVATSLEAIAIRLEAVAIWPSPLGWRPNRYSVGGHRYWAGHGYWVGSHRY